MPGTGCVLLDDENTVEQWTVHTRSLILFNLLILSVTVEFTLPGPLRMCSLLTSWRQSLLWLLQLTPILPSRPLAMNQSLVCDKRIGASVWYLMCSFFVRLIRCFQKRVIWECS